MENKYDFAIWRSENIQIIYIRPPQHETTWGGTYNDV